MACASDEYTLYESDAILFEFLDVGQGDSTLVIMPSGRLALVDFGEKRSPFKTGYLDSIHYTICTIAQNSKKRALSVPTLDHLFLTHPDGDHYNKIPDLLATNWGNYDTVYTGKNLQI